MSKKMFDDLIAAAPLHHPQAAERVAGLITTIADRVAACHGDDVKLSDLASTLRFDPDAMALAILCAPIEPETPAEQPAAENVKGAGDLEVKA